MSSNLKVNTILPSTGTNVAIGTAGGSVDFAGTLKVGIVTARDGQAASTAVYYGDGSNLTSLPSQVTISNNANNRVITGGSGTNLNGEANLTFDGSNVIHAGSDGRRYSFAGGGSSHYMKFDSTLNGIILNGYGGIAFETNGTNERLRIASDGKIGINIAGSDNTSPVRNLDIADSSGAILRLISTDDSLGANERLGEIEFYSDDDDNAHIGAFIKAIADPSDAAGRRTALLFGTQNHDASVNAVEKFRIDCNGNFHVASGNIVFSTAGKGIDFSATSDGINSSSASSEVLDDYEEGSWTPIIHTQAGASNCTYSYRYAYYTKVGRQVTAHFYISWTGATNHSGYIYFNNLPYASSNLNSNNAIGSVMLHGLPFPSGYTDVVLYMGSNTSGTNLYYSKSGSGWDAGQHSNTGQIIASISYFAAS